MENKKTTELMSRKSTLKSKLMAAVSMLLVSAIMVSVTTYAWFILSTAPEVKGMSTTVGSNGALEMALVDYETSAGKELSAVLDSIPTAVGSSSAKVSLKEANKTWGNLVDLSDIAYGLDSIGAMYPARLNWTDANNKAVNGRNLLKYAQYGTDGRVAELADTTSGTYVNSAFVSNDNTYGVRGIGKAVEQAQEAGHLSSAKGFYRTAVSTANTSAKAAMDNAAPGIASIALNHGLKQDTFTAAQVNALKGIVTDLTTVADNIENALKWAVVAQKASGKTGTMIKTTDVTAEMLSAADSITKDNYAKLKTLRTNIASADTRLKTLDTTNTGATFTWDQISAAYTLLVGGTNDTTVGGATADELAEIQAKHEEVTWIAKAITLGNGSIPIVTKGGLFGETADLVDNFASEKIEIYYNTTKAPVTVTAQKSVTSAYLIGLRTTVNALKYEGGGNKDNFITEYYGYAVDLAFRSNAAGDLQLSGPKVRVSSADNSAEEMKGNGSTFTVESTNPDAKAIAALRIAFLDTATSKVIAVGKLGTPDKATPKVYPVNLYEFTVEDGILKVNDAKKITDNKILTLEQNKAVALTAVVYMDGDATEYAQQELKGKLNLQFATSAGLEPMQYSNYATAPLATTGVYATAVKVGESVALPKLTLNSAEITNGVVWTADPVANVEIAEGKVKGVTAGTVKMTATYTDKNGSHTFTYTLTVKDATSGG